MTKSDSSNLRQIPEQPGNQGKESRTLFEKLEAAIEQERIEWEQARTGIRPVRE